MRNVLKRIAYWTLPQGFYNLLAETKKRMTHEVKKEDQLDSIVIPEDTTQCVIEPHFASISDEYGIKLAHSNDAFKNIHYGQRCFILCNGPSVNEQNLLPLKDEIVFSVSSGYLQKDFSNIQPRYHCLPSITYSPMCTEETVVAWFREMESKIGQATLFLSSAEEPLVRRYGLFRSHNVHYLHFSGNMPVDLKVIPDICGSVPFVQSVPIMCLLLAMYMGFGTIYLLGAEHDYFRTGSYKYSFSSTVLSGKDYAISSDGEIRCSLYEVFHAHAALWSQYRTMKEIAKCNDIMIYNATLGGALDEFQRVCLEDVLRHSSSLV